MYARLLVVRDARPQAFRDEKCLSAWNGLTLSAFARAARLLDDDELATETAHLADAVQAHFLTDDPQGRPWLAHQVFEGQASGSPVLTDYAYLSRGVLDAYETTGDARLLALAVRLAFTMVELYEDAEAGGLFETLGDDPLLPGRTHDLDDGARPAGHSVALHHLARIAPLDDSGRLQAVVDKALDVLSMPVSQSPNGFGSLLAVYDVAAGPLAEIVLDGTPGDATYEALRAEVRGRLLPAALVIPDVVAAEAALVPAVFETAPSLLEGRRAEDVGGRAWVCKRGVCLLPADDVETFREQLPNVIKR